MYQCKHSLITVVTLRHTRYRRVELDTLNKKRKEYIRKNKYIPYENIGKGSSGKQDWVFCDICKTYLEARYLDKVKIV